MGAGPAGLAAATRAAEVGARVIVIDSGLRPGGQIWRHDDQHPPAAAGRVWMRRFRQSGALWMPRSTVVDASPGLTLSVVSDNGGYSVKAKSAILATGGREIFLPFPGWTRVNVMGAGGAQALLKGGLDVAGRRVVIAGSGPLLLAVAAAMKDAGAIVVCVAEQASMASLIRFAGLLWSQPSKLILAARYRARISIGAYRPGSWVVRADGTDRVETVTLTNGRREWTERCDLLCSSYGLHPATELARLLGCEIAQGRVVVDDLQMTSVAGVFSAGEATGVAGDAAAIAEGEIAGLAAVSVLDRARSRRLRRGQRLGRALADGLEATFAPRTEVLRLATPETIVCRCEDIRYGQLDRQWTGRQAKLYTRVGMGPCQGAVCGGTVERLFGWEAGSVRPPLFAPSIDAWMAATDAPFHGEHPQGPVARQ